MNDHAIRLLIACKEQSRELAELRRHYNRMGERIANAELERDQLTMRWFEQLANHAETDGNAESKLHARLDYNRLKAVEDGLRELRETSRERQEEGEDRLNNLAREINDTNRALDELRQDVGKADADRRLQAQAARLDNLEAVNWSGRTGGVLERAIAEARAAASELRAVARQLREAGE